MGGADIARSVAWFAPGTISCRAKCDCLEDQQQHVACPKILPLSCQVLDGETEAPLGPAMPATLTAQNICGGVCTAAGRSGAHVPEVPEGKRQGGRRNDKNHGVGFLRRFWRNQEGVVANCIPSSSITCLKKQQGVSWNWRTMACLLGFAAAGYFVLPVEVVQQFSSTAESVLGLVRVIAAGLEACQNNTPHKCS